MTDDIASESTKLHEAVEPRLFLLRLSDRLRTLDDPIAMQRTACTMLGEHFGVNRCMFAEVEGDEFVPGPTYLNGVAPMPQIRQSIYVFGDGMVKAVRSGDTVWSEDVSLDPRIAPAQAEYYRSLQIAAFAGAILIKGGRLVGAFAVNVATPRPWPPADLELLREVGDRIWDAVERARAEAALRRSEEQLRHAMTLRDEFLAVLSHELRTPLSAILIWAKMLRAGAVKAEDQAQAITVIEQSALAQRKLIEDLLDVSGMISGKLRVQMENAEIGSVLTAATEAVRPMAEAKRITLTLDLGEAPVITRVDRARLQQVVWNLANNAVKFTPSGGTVVVRLRQMVTTVRIEVEDSGRGIAPGFLPYVFERFRQGDSSTTRADGGLGLGLAIARQLVELHGGSIEAKSEGEGRGAKFVVVLPHLEMEEPAEPLHERDVRANTTPDPFVPEPVLRGVHVLFVEDEAHTRTVVQWLLEQCGAVVASVASAREALALFDATAERAAMRATGEERPFDVLVSDVGLPEKDGYELLAEVRRRPGGERLPALALTAYAREEDRQRAIEAGFAGYLAKPVEPRALVEMIWGMVGNDARR